MLTNNARSPLSVAHIITGNLQCFSIFMLQKPENVYCAYCMCLQFRNTKKDINFFCTFCKGRVSFSLVSATPLICAIWSPHKRKPFGVFSAMNCSDGKFQVHPPLSGHGKDCFPSGPDFPVPSLGSTAKIIWEGRDKAATESFIFMNYLVIYRSFSNVVKFFESNFLTNLSNQI